MSINRFFRLSLQILSICFILLVCFNIFASSAFAGPICDGICQAGESVSSFSPFENQSSASVSVLSEDSAILSCTSDALLLSKYNQAKKLLYTRHFSEAEEFNRHGGRQPPFR